MKPVNVAICDDEEYFLKELEKFVSVYANEERCELEIDTYQDPERLLEEMISGEKAYQLIFLDVEMPGMSGVEVAKKLRGEGYQDVICFVTGFEGYAFDAFSVEAMGYIRKPTQYLDVKKVIHKALIQIYYNRDAEEAKKRYLEVQTQRAVALVDIQKIVYLEKRRNQCVIHLESGEVVCYETLKHLFQKLNQQKFCYCHQGYIVNFDKIKEVKKEIICFGEGREVPVSRRYQSELKERHMNEIYRLRKELRRDG